MRLSQIFDNAKLYEVFQSVVLRRTTNEIIRNEILKPEGVSDILDFGCGVGIHSRVFSNANYLGIEPLESCVSTAKAKFSNSRTQFILGDHSLLKDFESNAFDLIIAMGVLHHIDEEIFDEFIRESFRILRPGGRLTTFDPVLHSQQSKISEWIVKQDRGEWVRTESAYVKTFRKYFSGEIKIKVYSKLLRMPYDHIAISVLKGADLK